ncbi:MAG: hypothetical protein V2B15_12855 [Bacteroidota bacterium]
MNQNLKNAKPGISSLILLFTLCSANLFAQIQTDRSLVLQECVNMYELRQHLSGGDPNADGPVYVVPAPEEPLPEGTGLTSFGRRVEPVTEAGIHERMIGAFFRFSKLEISGHSGTAVFSYIFNYDFSNNSHSTIEVTAELEKTPNGWSITKKTLK